MAPWRGRLGAPTGRTGPASGRHARERETRADDAAPGQRECRPLSSWRGVRRTRSCGFLPVGLDTMTPGAAGGSLLSAFTERRHMARTVTNGVCPSQVRIPPNAEIPAGTAPPRDGESFPPPACGGLCRPEAGVPSRPRGRAAVSRALPAPVSVRNKGQLHPSRYSTGSIAPSSACGNPHPRQMK